LILKKSCEALDFQSFSSQPLLSRLQGNPRFDARPLPATRATAAGDKAMIQKFLIKISPSRRILPCFRRM
jgi:hypothetical protein